MQQLRRHVPALLMLTSVPVRRFDPKKLLNKPRTRWPRVPELPADSPAPTQQTGQHPFLVQRTRSANLPVYSEFRNGRTRQLTVVRNASGDMAALTAELRRAVGEDVLVQQRSSAVLIKGNYTAAVREHLSKLGF